MNTPKTKTIKIKNKGKKVTFLVSGSYKKSKTKPTENKLLNRVKLASEIVLKEDEKLFKEMDKTNHSQQVNNRGSNRHTKSNPALAEMKSDYVGMSESIQKQPADKTQLEEVEITKETFDVFKEMAGDLLKDKCDFCGDKITRDNFGYLSRDIVSCNNMICLYDFIVKQNCQQDKIETRILKRISCIIKMRRKLALLTKHNKKLKKDVEMII